MMRRLALIALALLGTACPPKAPGPTPSPTPSPTPTVAPTPTPTPGDGCGEPAPPPAYEIVVKVHHAFCANLDSTIKVRDAAYCAKIGAAPEAVCPVRLEGTPDRVACETRLRGQRQIWTCEGCKVYPCDVPGNCECAGQVNTNPATAIVLGKGRVKTCTFDGKACGELVIQ